MKGLSLLQGEIIWSLLIHLVSFTWVPDLVREIHYLSVNILIDFSIWGKNQQYCSTLLNDLFCHFEFDLVSMFLLVILKSIDQIVDSATCVKRWAINLKWILFRTILQYFVDIQFKYLIYAEDNYILHHFVFWI